MELLYSHVARRPLAPHARNPQIPEALSAIIMKLLAKAPEERYQSVLGLRADLIECARLLDLHERTPFTMPLGTRDYPYDLQLSRKLYGRRKESEQLHRLFHKVREGGSALVLISGYAGVGKSALLSELQKEVLLHNGLSGSGKFDQLNRNTPYSSIAHALRELLQQILSLDSASLSRWRERISAALGASASSLALIVPELSTLLGPLPSAAELGPAESQNRFDIAVDALLRALCQNGQPLLLTLDDLQWADPASLRLIQFLFSQSPPRGLLVVAAYRDHEIDDTHPVRVTHTALLREGATITELKLQPLVFEDLLALLSDSLRLPIEQVEPLARTVFDKTQGNPFFTNQFLSALYRDGLLRFSMDHQRWEWNQTEIAQRNVTDNVVEFMAARLKLLSPSTHQLIKLAACIGHEFDLGVLARIAEQPAERIIGCLNEALQEGIIQPLSSDHRYLGLLDDGPQVSAAGSYRFIHDRVSEAAYALIPEGKRAAIRLRIGRILLPDLHANGSQLDDGNRLFTVVNHLNQGRTLLTDPAELSGLADLNRRAAERARQGAAFPTAAEYYRVALELLEQSGADDQQELHLQLLQGFAESESLCGRFDVAEQCFQRIDAMVPTILARAKATCLRLKLYQVAGRYREGVQLAERVLKDLGIKLPSTAEEIQAAISSEMADIPRNMGNRQIEDLLHAQYVTDPTTQAIINLLSNAAPCAYIGQPEAFPYITLKMLNISLQHGNTPESCFAYSAYGLMIIALNGDIDTGYRFSEMSVRLNEKFNDIIQRGTLLHIHADHINFWKNHIRTDLPILDRAFIACQQAGDYVYANYIAFENIWQVFEIGTPLEETLTDSERFARFSKKTRNEAVYQTIRMEQQFLRCLIGKTEQPLVLQEADFDLSACRKAIEEASFGCGIAFGYIIDLFLAYCQGDLRKAREAITAVTPHLGAVMAMPIESTFHFFRALTFARSLSDSGPEVSSEERTEWQNTLTADLEKLARWAMSSPDTFEAKYRIARAESLRLRGDVLAALTEYDAAISAAEASGFSHYAALACELAGRCLLAVRRSRPASFYLTLAQKHLAQWGATALVAQVDTILAPIRQHLSLIATEAAPEGSLADTAGSTSQEVTEKLLDVASVLKAAQAIASEIEMKRLLEQVMGIALTNSGAQRCVLLLQRASSDAAVSSGPNLVIVAVAAIEPDEVQVGLSIPLEQHGQLLASSVVGFVANTRETLILSNPHQDARFASDVYLKEKQPRSLLCMPLLHQNKLTGAMYLENGIVRDVFTRERIELVRLLGAQVASALENARLYEQVRATSAEVQAANARLEAEVSVRTAELNELNQHLERRSVELDAINQKLQQELTDRHQNEQERAELQERIIRTQQARLLEMATPLIPISNEIVVMPIIGTVDEERATQVLDTALRGVSDSHAQFVILDITGLRHVDTSVAGSLLRTARALQLLGAIAIITGIRAEVAQTLVSLGVDLRGIVCLSQLQGGIAYAQRQIQRAQR
jgi:predicted ATPase/GAF domain-containing protein